MATDYRTTMAMAEPTWLAQRRSVDKAPEEPASKRIDNDWMWSNERPVTQPVPTTADWPRSVPQRRVPDDEPTPSSNRDSDPDDSAPASHCTCDTVTARAQAPEGTGSEQDYCLRALQYDRTNNTGLLDNRHAFVGSNDLSCEPGDETIWWYEPSAEQVSQWLSQMSEPPPDVGHITVTMYFQCTRMLDEDQRPVAEESGSGVYLLGLCYD